MNWFYNRAVHTFKQITGKWDRNLFLPILTWESSTGSMDKSHFSVANSSLCKYMYLVPAINNRVGPGKGKKDF